MATDYKYYRGLDYYYKVNPYGTYYRWADNANKWELAEGNYRSSDNWSIWNNNEISELEVIIVLGKL